MPRVAGPHLILCYPILSHPMFSICAPFAPGPWLAGRQEQRGGKGQETDRDRKRQTTTEAAHSVLAALSRFPTSAGPTLLPHPAANAGANASFLPCRSGLSRSLAQQPPPPPLPHIIAIIIPPSCKIFLSPFQPYSLKERICRWLSTLS